MVIFEVVVGRVVVLKFKIAIRIKSNLTFLTKGSIIYLVVVLVVVVGLKGKIQIQLMLNNFKD